MKYAPPADSRRDETLTSSTRTERAATAAAYALAAVAVLAPELLGGATSETALAVYVGASVASCTAGFLLWRAAAFEGRLTMAGIGVLSAAVWTFVQAVRLPCMLTSWAQPERQAVAHELLRLGAIDSLRCGISAAPGSTWIALAQAACIAALVLTATAAARAGARSILIKGIALSAIVMATVALGHFALDATEVFGLYTPLYVKPRMLLAPLLNENHFAGLMTLGWPTCLALAFAARRPDGIVLWSLGALTVFTAGLLSLSRGGVAALLAGGLGFVLWRILAARQRGNGLSLVVAISCTCLGIGAIAGYDLVAKQFELNEGLANSKLALVAKLFPIFWQHAVVGIGRGALGDVSAATLLTDQHALYTENLPTQWLLEWGLPCSVLVAAALTASLIRCRWQDMRSTEVAVGCGLLALVCHNLLDYSLELPGVACTAAIAFGCLASREREGLAAPPGLSLRTATIAACMSAALATAGASPWLTFLSKGRLERALQSSKNQPDDISARPLRAALGSYPLDPTFIMLGAYRAAASRQNNVGRWLNLSMSVAPGWASPHLIAAQVLEQRGALSQAAIELSIAGGRAMWPAAERACAFVKRHPFADLAWTAASDDVRMRQASVEHLTSCLGARTNPVEGEKLLQHILEDYPMSIVAQRQLVTSALDQRNFELAIARARSAYYRQPTAIAAVTLLATALLQGGRPADALQILDGAPTAVRTEASVMLLELEIVSALKLDTRFEALVDRLLATHGHGAAERANILRVAAATLMNRQRFVAALSQAQAAYNLTQEAADLELVHQAALKAGIIAVALRTASQLCQVRHRVETYCRRGFPSAAP